MGDLGDRDQVQRMVELPIAARVQPVALLQTGGGFDRGGAVVGREAVTSRKPARVADLAEDDRGDDRADTVDIEQRSVRRCDGLRYTCLDRRDVAVETPDIAEQIDASRLRSARSTAVDGRIVRRGGVPRDRPSNATVRHRRRARAVRRATGTQSGCASRQDRDDDPTADAAPQRDDRSEPLAGPVVAAPRSLPTAHRSGRSSTLSSSPTTAPSPPASPAHRPLSRPRRRVCANSRPSPAADSTAHTRSSPSGSAHVNSRCSWVRSAVILSCASGPLVTVDRHRSVRRLVWVDPDQHHRLCLLGRVLGRHDGHS